MCGIAGSFAYHPAASRINIPELITIRDAMAARGPDGAGLWQNESGRIALAHRRLAIIDLNTEADQPMVSANNRFHLVFNGEIYNYRELRQSLEKTGFRFRTHSDTEVLLELFAQQGPAMLSRLRGMFALAIWDSEKNQLTFARDPYGIKPLYVADDGWTIRFASQVKALSTSAAISKQIEPAAIIGFCLFGSVPEPFTWRQAIRAVPAGCYQIADSTGLREPVAYKTLASCFSRNQSDTQDGQARVREALQSSVAAHQVSDVPVGLFLSSGIDSASLLALMMETRDTPLHATTLAFDEFANTPEDEAPLASLLAEYYGAEHRIRRINRSEFEHDLPAILAAMDQPSIDGINSWFVSKACHEQGLKVAISGVGGDELFGGYPSFQDVPRWQKYSKIPGSFPLLGKSLRLLMAPFMASAGISPKAAGMLELGGTWPGAYLLKRGLFMPWELAKFLPQDLIELGLERLNWSAQLEKVLSQAPDNNYARVSVLESQSYMRNQLLRDADWSSMAHSLEVRTPLVDSQLLSSLGSMLSVRGGNNKKLMALAPKKPLPDIITQRKKTGFVTPIGQWLQNNSELDGWKQHAWLSHPAQHWSRRYAAALLAREGVL